MRVSYRISLLVAIPLLVVATGSLIAWRSLAAATESAEALVDDLFAEVARESSDRAALQVRSVVPVMTITAASLRDDPDALERPVLANRLATALSASPDLARASFVGADGALVSVHREPDGVLRADLGELEAGVLNVREHALEEGRLGAVLGLERARDPRSNAEFVAARAARGRVWLPPHPLAETGAPGISCALAIAARDGRFLGVLALDLDLEGLSRFVRALELSPRARVLVFAEDGALVAHSLRGADAALLRDVADLPSRAFASHVASRAHDHDGEHAARREDDSVHHFHFEHGGEEWLASVTTLEIDAGLTWKVGVLAPEEDFLGFVGESIRSASIIALVALALALAVAFVLATRVSRPLSTFAGQLSEVGRFELDGPSPPPSVFVEIDQIQSAMQGMKRGLKSFASFVPRDVVRAVLASGREAELGGSLREVTIFFSDVAGFTSLGEKVTPNELVDMLSGYLEAMTDVIASNGGTVDKFIGDGIMALSGAPADDGEHAARACEAALRCQRRLEALRADPAHAWLRTAETRIGIASGEALVGNVGTHARMNYTAMGDVVNLAARLEAQNKAYGTRILASEPAYAAARDRVLGRAIDLVAVKGKAQGVRVYAICWLREEVTEREERVAELSERALARYLARDFEGAARCFDEILSLLPGDRPATALRARALALAKAPPPQEWDGVHVSETK